MATAKSLYKKAPDTKAIAAAPVQKKPAKPGKKASKKAAPKKGAGKSK